ncbi:hypothetical protein GCWU000246_00454 [Jonquetella anthropi E3_33 E1]|nr:hypothetical protein GCWU000246_00454 [Jonquetella anthropi E3_33 E1]
MRTPARGAETAAKTRGTDGLRKGAAASRLAPFFGEIVSIISYL